MSEIGKLAEKYYRDEKYNCSEGVIRAANEYYSLGLGDEDMKMVSGFGAGMFSGLVCGALTSSVAAVSKMIIKTKAREQMDELRPKIHETVKTFQEYLGGTTCKELKPKYFTKEDMCLKTTVLAAEALEMAVDKVIYGKEA